MNYQSFCGGIFETNCYLLQAPEGWILFDAPEGACDWVRSLDADLKLLLLTHGHIDHVQDVASIGRGDLPGGDIDVLITGIRRKLFPLGDDVTVLPGHGAPTKVGTERRTNPFLRGSGH